MRVIAGTARRLNLKTVPGMETRPTTDRIKETLFNILQPEMPECRFLDLFSGSGGIGIEALSRGAAYAVFVENNRKACACIEDNIHFTKFDRETKLYQSDVISAIRSMEGKYKFDVIFMDPPYTHLYEKDVLECLATSSVLKEDTLIIVEASLHTSFDYLEEMGYTLKKLKTYKTNVHAFITKNA